MAIILREEDAEDWIYKGEGAANLVVSYGGSSPSLIGKVLRLQKASEGRTRSENGCEVLSRHERLLWGHVREIVESTSKENAEQAFVMHVMSPLLDSVHIDGGIRITVTREFLESIERNVHSQRPAWRVDAAELDKLCGSALLVSDHTVFLSGTSQQDICIAVELKPKCGFLPSSEFIAKRNAIKKHVSRFKMHQFLKLEQGEISQISEYDPLDLFSGSKDRIYRAIMALFATPQNNFRIFLNGSLIFGGLEGAMYNGAYQSRERNANVEELIKSSGLQLGNFFELVVEALFRSGILDRLHTAQRLDVLDIEGAIHAYYNIISQPCLVCKNLSDEDLLHRCAYLHSISLEESLKIVREYLIASTVKDISLVINFRRRMDEDKISPYDSICLKSSKQNFEYKEYFIDLDMKPLNKMVHYYDLDQKIVNFYKKNGEISKIPATAGSEDEQIRHQH